ncbi:Iron binding protein SufA for iron-sulfur cluster assembly [Salmonella enterica subsp. enterica serovar Gaminara str. A4-567]|nr:Iron binding protein SufA for iron-sulfur cluster assembly [Salmonella enterica subsp. enterica serovar Gaminara str. A4-567]
MELHSDTFNPEDFPWQGLTLTPAALARADVNITPAAAAHIRELAAKQPGMLGVRLSVKQTGCAGFGYVLDTVREPDKDDLVFEAEGAKLFAPLQAMPFIDGTEVDYVQEGLNQLFKFHNPKAQNECGCGESFGV